MYSISCQLCKLYQLTNNEIFSVLPQQVAISVVDVFEELLVVIDCIVAMFCEDKDFIRTPEACGGHKPSCAGHRALFRTHCQRADHKDTQRVTCQNNQL